MSAPPPEPADAPTQHEAAPPPPGARSFGGSEREPFALLPVPGNAELLIYVLALLLIGIVTLASDDVDAGDFVGSATIITAAYLISRGIAKASRVFEY